MRLGIDIGGTKIEGVALSEGGKILASTLRETQLGAEGVLSGIRTTVRQLSNDAGPARSLGVGIPGQVDPGGSYVRQAVNLQLESLNLGSAIQRQEGIPVRVDNDVNAAAMGAYSIRRSRPASLGYLNLGTGVAAGIVIEGHLWRGAKGAAGEIGHFCIDPHGPRCACGQRGCIEVFAGGRAVSQAWGGSAKLPLQEMFDAADAGDDRAKELRQKMEAAVSSAIQLLVLSFDVEVVAIGGGAAALGERLFSGVRKNLRQLAMTSPFFHSLDMPSRVEALPDGHSAGAVGAALIGRP